MKGGMVAKAGEVDEWIEEVWAERSQMWPSYHSTALPNPGQNTKVTNILASAFLSQENTQISILGPNSVWKNHLKYIAHHHHSDQNHTHHHILILLLFIGVLLLISGYLYGEICATGSKCPSVGAIWSTNPGYCYSLSRGVQCSWLRWSDVSVEQQ